MFAPLVMLSLDELDDPSKHTLYNELEHLQRRPEALAQPGVAWSDRWVRSPDCVRAGGTSAGAHAGTQYAGLHWFRPPAERSLREFHQQSCRDLHTGRQPDAQWRRRTLHELLVPLKGYVTQRALVSPEALAFRPARGAYLSMSRLTGRDAASEAVSHWYDQVRIPDLLECRGAAGAWTFAGRSLFRPNRDPAATVLRLLLVYLDGDPLDFMADMRTRESAWRAAGRLPNTTPAEVPLFAAPLRTIVPWRWNWFDVDVQRIGA